MNGVPNKYLDRLIRGALTSRGATLLELLISLIILSLLAQLVFHAVASQRLAKLIAVDRQLGADAALAWQAGRDSGDSWTQGSAGDVPRRVLTLDSQEMIRWQISAVVWTQGAERRNPDSLWRVLLIWRTHGEPDSGRQLLWKALVRLPRAAGTQDIREAIKPVSSTEATADVENQSSFMSAKGGAR